ncbi:competence type IV pilus minor pilin ComGE [Bacillus sonorensis]|uniref:DNA transport machinery protein ComGE n=2 Tax=Bacillus sonorensis TaxID=119858 RepID=M5P601_9BACI|nr:MULTISPECIES: competence type IV pilus minor pilin ComGE [Bacillus]EME74849.1 DNA transport machinery protein ComGE [Bacillus sonorensis L12]MBG9916232.1 chromosome partitioning protein ParA [Bacillus sonorensis]MCF7617821.1 chromosome partitioning protein ParA [Bacillus sonorensis]MCY7856540.1 chromosome partitioning protein ParA [Bacillus sonorensis]MCY8025753.1 chromosome partitioning protein ParA [Bacillus sonorensis]
MFKKNRGFMTLETVSAFSIWMMIAAFLIPAYHQLELKADMMGKEEEAYRILDEKISRYMLTGRYQAAETVFYQGTAYFIEWEEKGDEYKVCISIEDRKDRQHCFGILKTKGLYPS